MDLASFSSFLIRLIQVHGPWIISVVVALESPGVPLPGETILVAAALLAAATNQIVQSSETGSDTRSGAASECRFFANTGATFVWMKTDC